MGVPAPAAAPAVPAAVPAASGHRQAALLFTNQANATQEGPFPSESSVRIDEYVTNKKYDQKPTATSYVG